MMLESESKCQKCGHEKEHIGGSSAHSSNWYCPQCEKEGLPVSSARVRDAYIKELEQQLAAEREAKKKAEASNAELLVAFNRAMGGDTHMGEPVIQNDFKDAYIGSREDLLVWKQRAESAEQRIRETQEQEPHCWIRNGYACFELPPNLPIRYSEREYQPLYAFPIPPADVAELQRELSNVESELDAMNDNFQGMLKHRNDLQRENAELKQSFRIIEGSMRLVKEENAELTRKLGLAAPGAMPGT